MTHDVGVFTRRRIVLPADPYFAAPAAASAAYTGPGDIQSGAVAWGGLRAFNGAYAASLGSACDLHDGAGTLGGTVHVQADGTLNASEVSTLISGGFTKIGKLYDQTGNGHHFTQTENISYRPTISLTDGPNSLPTIDNIGGGGVLETSDLITLGQPYFYTGVVRTSSGADQYLAGDSVGSADNVYIIHRNSSSQFRIISGSGEVGSTAAVSNTWYHVTGMVLGGNGTIWVNSSINTPSGVGSAAFAGVNLSVVGVRNIAWYDGRVSEIGLWSGDVTTNQAALNTNAHTFWGF